MHQKTQDIQRRYEGFLSTPSLWKEETIYNMQQFEIPFQSAKIDIEIDDKMRLGRYVERFVSFQIAQCKSARLIAENVQIQSNKITLGELDCILIKNNKIIHLEISYKFYLYDVSVGISEIAHFIGPNRKDSLIDKLTKLAQKQLPLLFTKTCSDYLDTVKLKAENISQQIYFKAQLFVPFSSQNIVLSKINQACVVGYYIKQDEIKALLKCKFHIPTKKDWLLIPHKNISWLSFSQFIAATKDSLENQFSPLCWCKKPNGEIDKFFFVWWN
jgi:hypothetical protein